MLKPIPFAYSWYFLVSAHPNRIFEKGKHHFSPHTGKVQQYPKTLKMDQLASDMSDRQRAIIEKMDREFAKDIDRYVLMQDKARQSVLTAFAEENVEANETNLVKRAQEAAEAQRDDEIFNNFKSLESPMKATAWDSPLHCGSATPQFALFQPRSFFISPVICEPTLHPNISQTGAAYLAGLNGETLYGNDMHQAYSRGHADRNTEPSSPLPTFCQSQVSPMFFDQRGLLRDE